MSQRKSNNNVTINNNNSKVNRIEYDGIPFYHYSKFENVKLINKNGYKAHINKIVSQQETTVAVTLKHVSLNNKFTLNNFIKEVKRHRKLENNDSILKFYGITKEENTNNYMIALEYANNGSLRQYLKTNFRKFDWNIKLNLAKQISNALMNLHDNNIIHGKLTSESILVRNGIIKLNDFSINYLKSLTTTVTIPIQYTDFRYLELFNKSLDIYSLGIILWEISNNGISPFERDSITKSSLLSSTSTNNNILDLMNDLIAKLKREKSKTGIPPPRYKEIFTDCLKYHGNSRPGILEIVNALSEININSDTDINAKNKLEKSNEEEIHPSINSITTKTNDYNIIFIKKLFEFFINVFKTQSLEIQPIVIKNYVREHNLNPVKILHKMIRYPSYYWFTSLIGFFYQFGIGTVIDNQMAFKFFNLASNERIYMKNISLKKFYDINEEIGTMYLAHIYFYGRGVEKDLKKSFRIYSKVADEGSSIALNRVAYCYDFGFGVEKSEEKAFELYLKSAKKGSIVAQYNVGECYKDGIGIAKDEIKGFQLQLKIALTGNLDAIHNIGYCYEYGIGVDVDKKEAFKWYFKGAGKGDPMTQHNLGTCYKNSIGIDEEDHIKSFEWYRRSAENGCADGQYMVGKSFYEGYGTGKDIVKAIYWSNKAKENGNINANTLLEEVIYQMHFLDYDNSV
ncbi:hypothetical protein Glove_350g114 [Diversispora epigaea]|uniref:Protein kinase domain-containing protein n=1 Tax=Diversispora epigaea TaxID=1348612 RepID=A0A397HG16_9GLOM|nr:hypothetical protein Glove_350g114 [Diversispora epigaea]